MPELIPAGKTSLVRKGPSPLQVQTEYANRPYPRITTTILSDGQVLHKIEKKLERAVESEEEQTRTELIIQRQHEEVELFIHQNGFLAVEPVSASGPEGSLPGESDLAGPSATSTVTPEIVLHQPLSEKFASIAGFEHVFELDNDGHFKSEHAAGQFKKRFGSLYKSVPEIIEVFPACSDDPATREKGVYEVERERLYLASTGSQCYFITIVPPAEKADYEKSIGELILEE